MQVHLGHMNKQHIRIGFSGPDSVDKATLFAHDVIPGLLHADVRIDSDRPSVVQIYVTSRIPLGDTLRDLAKFLSRHDSWEFVGALCTKHKPPVSMVWTQPLHKAGSWRCHERGCGAIIDDDIFMTYREFSLLLHATATKPEPSALAPGTITGRLPSGWGESPLSGKIDYNKPNPVGQIPRNSMENKREMVKTYLGIDYGSLEVSVLAAQLNIKPPQIAELHRFVKFEDGIRHLENGGALVATVDRNQWPTAANLVNTLEVYTRKSHGPKTLIVLELDSQKVHQMEIEKESVGETARAIVKRQELRQAVKPISFSATPIEQRGPKNQALQAEVETLKKENNDLRVALHDQRKELGKRTHELEVTRPTATLTTVADEMFRFLAGVNFQDHSIAEQKKYLELMSKLRNALQCSGIGSSD